MRVNGAHRQGIDGEHRCLLYLVDKPAIPPFIGTYILLSQWFFLFLYAINKGVPNERCVAFGLHLWLAANQ